MTTASDEAQRELPSPIYTPEQLDDMQYALEEQQEQNYSTEYPPRPDNESASNLIPTPTIDARTISAKAKVKAPAKRRGRPPKNPADVRDWSDEEVMVLINLWQTHESLYNTSHELYYNRDIRQITIDSVTAKLGENGITATSKQVNKKLTDLRTYYGAQRRMVEGSKDGTGKGTATLYVSPWKFFDSLHFLRDSFTPRQTTSNAPKDLVGSSGSTSAVNISAYNENNAPSAKSLKLMKDAETKNLHQVMANATNLLGQLAQPKEKPAQVQKDQDDYFCDLIRSMIGTVPETDLKSNMRLEIQQVILNYKRMIASQNV
ncbi:uncharacterized protein [Clytia hemisphaerica]|uniref:uncharacterized protein n=1 Tax=Clytia hemisphaerica TaxID=252671 RepID=UPI0034D6DD8B